MKLTLQKLTQWHHTESYNIALSGPMSPMAAAKDFVSKVFDKGDMVITGLFRIKGDGEATFTTWEDADIEPVQVDVICCILNFRHMAVFGEIGSRYMPIALILDGEAQFSELYTTYKWESAPTIQEIADVLSTINLTDLKKQFEDYRWTVKAEQADDWMLNQPMKSQLTILGEKIPRDALMKWDAMSPQEKYKIYKREIPGSPRAACEPSAYSPTRNTSRSLPTKCLRRVSFPIGVTKASRDIMAWAGSATSRMAPFW